MSDIISWDKAIGTKVKSSNGKDLGGVESIASEYVEAKEGVVSKKHYFIPKFFIQGFDGNSLYASLTKDEVKDRFERDSPPPPSEFQTEAYREQVRRVESNYLQFVHGVRWMAKEPATEEPQAREPDSMTVETIVDVEEKRTTEGG